MCVSKMTRVAGRTEENNSPLAFFVAKLHLRNLAALHALLKPLMGRGPAHRSPPMTPHQQDLPRSTGLENTSPPAPKSHARPEGL